MLFLTRWFGVTGSDAERDFVAEQADIVEIVQIVLQMQAGAAGRTVVRSPAEHTRRASASEARFEVFDVATGRDRALAARLAIGIFAKPGSYPAVVRFANSDPKVRSPTSGPTFARYHFPSNFRRADRSPDRTIRCKCSHLPDQRRPRLPGDRERTDCVEPAQGLPGGWRSRTNCVLVRTIVLAQRRPIGASSHTATAVLEHRAVPARAGGFVKYSAPHHAPAILRRFWTRNNPNGLAERALRHVTKDATMSCFDFRLQFLDTEKMTYWGKRQDANFWIENASVEWNEARRRSNRCAADAHARVAPVAGSKRSHLYRRNRRIRCPTA